MQQINNIYKSWSYLPFQAFQIFYFQKFAQGNRVFYSLHQNSFRQSNLNVNNNKVTKINLFKNQANSYTFLKFHHYNFCVTIFLIPNDLISKSAKLSSLIHY